MVVRRLSRAEIDRASSFFDRERRARRSNKRRWRARRERAYRRSVRAKVQVGHLAPSPFSTRGF